MWIWLVNINSHSSNWRKQLRVSCLVLEIKHFLLPGKLLSTASLWGIKNVEIVWSGSWWLSENKGIRFWLVWLIPAISRKLNKSYACRKLINSLFGRGFESLRLHKNLSDFFFYLQKQSLKVIGFLFCFTCIQIFSIFVSPLFHQI